MRWKCVFSRAKVGQTATRPGDVSHREANEAKPHRTLTESQSKTCIILEKFSREKRFETSVWSSQGHFVSLNTSRFITDNQCQRDADGQSSIHRKNELVWFALPGWYEGLYSHTVHYELVCLIEELHLNDVQYVFTWCDVNMKSKLTKLLLCLLLKVFMWFWKTLNKEWPGYS